MSPWLRNFARPKPVDESGPASVNAREFADSVNARCVMPSVRLLDGKVTRGGEMSGGRPYLRGSDVDATRRQVRLEPTTKLRRAK